MAPPIAVLDVDGTLVDTNYHHAIAWYRAFREHGLTLPVWRIHRHIGMGGDQLVAAVAGDLVEAWTTSADVQRTKPDPDLVHTVAILTGGFSEQELRQAGAGRVFASLSELCERLDETPLA